MKVAHLIMAYKNPKQLERLIKRLNHPEFDIFIHLDKKIDIREFRYLEGINRASFIQSRVFCNWGGFSFVKAIVVSMQEILLKSQSYDFINLMSAQDYPIKSVDEFHNYLLKYPNHSFLAYEEFGKSDWWRHAVSRFESYHFTDVNLKGRYLFQRVLNKLAPKRRFPLTCSLYGSSVSTWWTLSRDCAQYVVSFVSINKKLMNFMRYTWGADEFLFPTIILNSPFKELTVNNNLRHIEWEEGKSNPKVLKKGDLENLMKSDKFFARKFDISIDDAILNEIDKMI